MALWLLEKVSCGWTAKDEAISKPQTAQRQVSENQEWGMPFGLGDGVASMEMAVWVTRRWSQGQGWT